MPESADLKRERQQVARAASKAREWTTRRNEAIVSMREAGATLKDIALAAGLTDMGVLRILDKEAPSHA